jgi:hypothetical protein
MSIGWALYVKSLENALKPSSFVYLTDLGQK